MDQDTHNEDRRLVSAILNRDTRTTREFLYRKCYPLFRSIHSRYHTDCDTPVELANEIYLYIMTPSPGSGLSKLERFEFRCSLMMWLKVVTENYCRRLYRQRIETDEISTESGDRILPSDESLMENTRNLDMNDVYKLLEMMPNQRYRRLIELRYLKEMTNEETAGMLDMTMANYYNKHRLAKEQFCSMLRKEGLL
ncbi:MAG: sigma-70 family RNA polymerase sigma factor [Clostridium sp.]|nr:sigma-70 family RNA polymerase sigma factor [Clostridium sp.]